MLLEYGSDGLQRRLIDIGEGEKSMSMVDTQM